MVSASLIGETLQIQLIPHHAQMPSCSGCLYPCSLIHDQVERSIRDLPVLGHPVVLITRFRRLRCPNCGTRAESVSWLDRYSRLTVRLRDAVIRACKTMATLHVAQVFGLHWETVRVLERRALEQKLFTGASGFDGRIQRKQVGLIGDTPDRARHQCDLRVGIADPPLLTIA